jgi:hypothetical protein
MRAPVAGPQPLLAGPQLVVVGLDHTTAPIDLRERVAFADSEVPAALAHLTDPDDGLLEQAAILSTYVAYSSRRSPRVGRCARAPPWLAE